MSYPRVLLDINTQRDFLRAKGALPVANRTALMPRLRELMNWARQEGIPVISAMESHRPTEIFHDLPPHCLDGTPGQQKVSCTLLPRRLLVEVDNTLALPQDLLERYHQVIFRKRSADVFSNPKADRLLTELRARQFVVFGVAAERSVRTLVLGLLARHKRVVVVQDACGFWNTTERDLAFQLMLAKGAILVSCEQIIGSPAPPEGDNGFVRPRKRGALLAVDRPLRQKSRSRRRMTPA